MKSIQCYFNYDFSLTVPVRVSKIVSFQYQLRVQVILHVLHVYNVRTHGCAPQK